MDNSYNTMGLKTEVNCSNTHSLAELCSTRMIGVHKNYMGEILPTNNFVRFIKERLLFESGSKSPFISPSLHFMPLRQIFTLIICLNRKVDRLINYFDDSQIIDYK